MGFSLVKGKTALSGKSRFFDKAGQKIIRQVPEIGRVLWQISAGCAANRHLKLEVATTSRAGARAKRLAREGWYNREVFEPTRPPCDTVHPLR